MLRRSPLTRKTSRRKEGPSADRPEHPQAKEPKPCAQCKKPFTPRSMGHTVCTPRCLLAQIKAKQKAERESDKARRQALKGIPDLIAEAQVEFNAYIRARDKDRPCFVCDRPFDPAIPGRAMHAGHVRSRGAAGHLRFHEDNCMGECEGCNGPHGAKPHQIEAGATRRIGPERYDALKNDNVPHKWAREELIGIKAHYRAKRKELEKEKS